jgi:hypothetical protein
MTRPPLRREVAGLGEKNVAYLHGFVAMPFNEGQSRHRDRFQLHPSRTDKLVLEAAGFEVFGQMRTREPHDIRQWNC